MKPNSNEPIWIWKKIGSCIRLARHFTELISDIFPSVDGGHDPRYGIWNHPACLLCNIIRIFSKVEDYEIENKTPSTPGKIPTPNTNERKWQQPRLQLHLVTKSRSRRELGLPTSSAAVVPLKMMPCMMFRSIQTFYGNGKFTEPLPHFLCTDRRFYYFHLLTL